MANNVKKQCKTMPNLKAPGHDEVHRFWIKRLFSMHDRIATQINLIQDGTKEIPSLMTQGRTV